MTRILANAWGDENCDLSFALIVIDPLTAQWWLDNVKPDVDAMFAKYTGQGNMSGGFSALELWDWQPDFLRLDYYEDLSDDLVEEIEQNEFVSLPDKVVLASAKIARMELCVGVADETGVHWRGREKHSMWEVETPRFTWEMLSAMADEMPPADNSGLKHCWWCGKPTEEIVLLTSVGNQCPDCKK
jgi:hypothetical protein